MIDVSMFNRRSESVAVEPLSGLPAGFDDPGSESFVPEELRRYWPADAGFALEAMLDPRLVSWARHDMGSDRYLELDALDEAGRAAQIPQYWGDRHSGWRHDVPHHQRLVFVQRLGAIDEELLPKPNQPQQVPQLQRNRWIHLLSMEAAQAQLAAVQQGERIAAEQAAAAARWNAEHLCQVCGETAESVGSVVVGADGLVAQVDPDCLALLVARRVARVAAREVGGRSLAERADAWLDSPPAAAGPAAARTVGEVLAEREAERLRQAATDPRQATMAAYGMLGLSRVQHQW